MNRFENKTIVVTGGASGIGLTTVARLLSEGANVCVWDIEVGGLDQLPAERLSNEVVNLVVPEEVYGARDRTLQRYGKIDGLICSAGITGPNALVMDYPEDAWRQVFDVNMHAVFYCNKAVIAAMTEAGYGRIVNIASIAGKEGNPNASAYSASKAAVIGFTKSMGKELANKGITVNCVTPAAVKTAMFDQMSKEHIAYMLSKIPMGRFGKVDEMAAMILWLVSEECSFSTGAVFDLSGGRAVY